MKILVPFDFSASSERAVKYAVALAVKTNAIIELIHVIKLPVIAGPLSVPVFNFDDALKDDLIQNTKKEFDNILRQFKTGDVKIQSTQLFGHISGTVLECAKKNNFDMIVVGSQGAGKFREFIMGSNAMRIVRSAAIPVVVIKDQLHRDIKSIVFPHSLEIEDQADLIEKVIAMQTIFNAHLHLVSVNSPLSFTSDESYRLRLERFLSHFKLTNFTARIYSHEDYAEGITHYAKSVDADLIMIATHGRTGIARLVNTSVAEDVIHQSLVPVWTFSTKDVPVPAT